MRGRQKDIERDRAREREEWESEEATLRLIG